MLSESPVPLQFTPVLGVLAGIVLSMFLLILVVVMVIRLKYRYSKSCIRSSLNKDNEEEEADCDYRSFNFSINEHQLVGDSSISK